ncbi:alpha/beta hydrolase [Burkholderia pseudomallei]|nr:alpha/beta hydrolase [Burkholderia pseudomallei]
MRAVALRAAAARPCGILRQRRARARWRRFAERAHCSDPMRLRRESMRPAHDCRNGLLARFGLGIDRGPSGIARSSVRPTGRA